MLLALGTTGQSVAMMASDMVGDETVDEDCLLEEVPVDFFPRSHRLRTTDLSDTVRATPNFSKLAPDLSEVQWQQLGKLVKEFPQVFQDKPGRTNVAEHEIHVGNSPPIQQKPYRIPYSQRLTVQQEIEEMLAAGIVRPSVSHWASPIMLVKKKTGEVCFCVDFRRLNQVAKLDAYPMPPPH